MSLAETTLMIRSFLAKGVVAVLMMTFLLGCNDRIAQPSVEQWSTHEMTLYSENSFKNGYTDVEVWMQFVNDRGDSLVRPAFWDGGKVWKVRFAPPDSGRVWSWTSYASVSDEGLSGKQGTLRSVTRKSSNQLLRRGLLRMSPGKRNVVHADGTPFLIVGDTPWSIPYRATTQQVHVYADDRKSKGFNTALLITLQPDKNAQGPEARNTVLGFDRAFEDLDQGFINKLKPDYFRVLDSIVQILIDHEIVPVYAPFAHGYGWKGETPVGPRVTPEEYVRYCKYLLARYGSRPALWLLSLDTKPVNVPGVKPAGETMQKWDAYQQPVGLHYSPWDDYIAGWAKGDSSCCFHYNKNYQEEPWLDFQWAQTGHDGIHFYHKVQRMYDNLPTKAVMNGEPTYEGMGGGILGLGWWQGHDAWMQLMHGGTMGVVYGAVSLWQWKITRNEPGWEQRTNAPLSWRDALDLEGSKYVGSISKAFRGFDFVDMQRRWDLSDNASPVLAKEGSFYISYLEKGGKIRIKNVPEQLPFFWFDPMKGDFTQEGKTTSNAVFKAPDNNPWVLIIGQRRH